MNKQRTEETRRIKRVSISINKYSSIPALGDGKYFNPISVFKLEEKQRMDEYLNYPSMLSAISLSYSARHCFHYFKSFYFTHDILCH